MTSEFIDNEKASFESVTALILDIIIMGGLWWVVSNVIVPMISALPTASSSSTGNYSDATLELSKGLAGITNFIVGIISIMVLLSVGLAFLPFLKAILLAIIGQFTTDSSSTNSALIPQALPIKDGTDVELTDNQNVIIDPLLEKSAEKPALKKKERVLVLRRE